MVRLKLVLVGLTVLLSGLAFGSVAFAGFETGSHSRECTENCGVKTEGEIKGTKLDVTACFRFGQVTFAGEDLIPFSPTVEVGLRIRHGSDVKMFVTTLSSGGAGFNISDGSEVVPALLAVIGLTVQNAFDPGSTSLVVKHTDQIFFATQSIDGEDVRTAIADMTWVVN